MSKEKFFILKSSNGPARLIGAMTATAAKKFALGAGGVSVVLATETQIVDMVAPGAQIQVIDGATVGKFFFVSGDGPDRIVRAQSARKVLKAIGTEVNIVKASQAELVEMLTSGVKVERAVEKAVVQVESAQGEAGDAGGEPAGGGDAAAVSEAAEADGGREPNDEQA